MAPARAHTSRLLLASTPRSLAIAAFLVAVAGSGGDTFAAVGGPHADAPAALSLFARRVTGAAWTNQDVEVLRLRSRVDASATGDEATALQQRCEQELGALFLQNSVLPAEASDGAELRVRVTPTDDPENPGYAVRVELWEGPIETASLVEASTRETTCELCTHGEVASSVRKESEALLALARERAAARAEGGEGASGDTQPEGPEVGDQGSRDPTGATELGKDRGQPLSTLGWAGVAAMTLGVVGVGTGAGLVVVGQSDPIGPDYRQVRDFRGGGAAALGVGAGMLVTGAVLLAVDRVRAKKRASAPTAAR